jgi:hypothetical protein
MTIRVVYHDNTCDTIPVFILHLGIDCKKIKMFYRSSERRWITVGADPIRKQNQIPYTGSGNVLCSSRLRSFLSHAIIHDWRLSFSGQIPRILCILG